jgi:hypothetical protein
MGSAIREEQTLGTFTVRQGRRYEAAISLGLLESFAGNDLIAARLEAVGFTDVTVEGSGASRRAQAVWPNADATAALPPQVSDVTEIDEA